MLVGAVVVVSKNRAVTPMAVGGDRVPVAAGTDSTIAEGATAAATLLTAPVAPDPSRRPLQ